MLNDKKENNNVLSILVLLLILLVISGVSYALWQIALSQTEKNRITTGCFKILFKDKNAINLQETLPITDEEGIRLIPYEFTITNTCSNNVEYQVNLEILNETTLDNMDYIKTMFQEKEPSILSSNPKKTPTLSNASNSYMLEKGYLEKNEEKNFKLRLWLNEETPTTEEIMNKIFSSKITVVTSYRKEEITYAERITTCGENGYNAATCMLENSKYDKVNLTYDETIDNNLRYIGKNPNNYVDFNNEKWRIVGIMNNIEDENGDKKSRIKLIRDESIGNYSWDTSPSNINNGQGVNEWSQADIMKLLNPDYEKESIGGSLYWNKQTGQCYSNNQNESTTCDFTSTGLTSEAKKLFGKAIWYLGTNDKELSYDNIKTSKFYDIERNENTEKVCFAFDSIYCNDDIKRTTKWLGEVGLIYPSDYGYATSGGNNIDKNSCLNKVLFEWNNYDDCINNNWLTKKSNIFSITPYERTHVLTHVYTICSDGHVGGDRAHSNNLIIPSIYLYANVKITQGAGTKENSYKLSI